MWRQLPQEARDFVFRVHLFPRAILVMRHRMRQSATHVGAAGGVGAVDQGKARARHGHGALEWDAVVREAGLRVVVAQFHVAEGGCVEMGHRVLPAAYRAAMETLYKHIYCFVNKYTYIFCYNPDAPILARHKKDVK